jgi:hypothetical protein
MGCPETLHTIIALYLDAFRTTSSHTGNLCGVSCPERPFRRCELPVGLDMLLQDGISLQDSLTSVTPDKKVLAWQCST